MNISFQLFKESFQYFKQLIDYPDNITEEELDETTPTGKYKCIK